MNKARAFFRVVCAGILIMAFFQIAFVRAESTNEAVSTAEPGTTPGAVVNNAVSELDNRKIALDARQRELDEQEQRMREQGMELDRKIKDLERLRAEVSGELDKNRKNSEERVLKMVSVFESMTPKAASGVLETLDDWLSVEVLKRMDVKRVAKVMNLMDKSRSAKLSELMTGYFRPETMSRANAQTVVPGTQGSEPVRKISSQNSTGQEVVDASLASAPASKKESKSAKKGGER